MQQEGYGSVTYFFLDTSIFLPIENLEMASTVFLVSLLKTAWACDLILVNGIGMYVWQEASEKGFLP